MVAAEIKAFPLSSQQEQLWRRLSQSDDGQFCAQTTISIEGELDVELLKRAVHRVVNQHQSLRTTFRRWPGLRIPLQVIADVTMPHWREVDLSGRDALQQQQYVRTLVEEERSRAVDFEQGPLISGVLAILTPHTHVLLITISSMCADRQTLRNMFDEIGKRYGVRRGENETPEEPFQYPDFSEWQRELHEVSGEAEAARAYWTRQAKSPFLPLPFKATGHRKKFQRMANFSVELNEPLSTRLEQIAGHYEISTRGLLLACWKTLLYKLTGEQWIVSGYICNERSYDLLSGAGGLFAQCLPVRSHLSGAMSFSSVLLQVEEAVRECEYWQEYFIEEEKDHLSASASDPLVGFEYQEWPPPYTVAGVTFKQEDQYCHLAPFEIKLSAARRQTSLALEIHYDRESLEPGGIENIAGCLSELLRSIARNPEALVADLNLLTDSNRRVVLEAFNETAAYYPRQSCFHTLFEEQAAQAPENIAVVCEGQRLSYSELNTRANQIARVLRQSGVGPDTPVCLLMERSVDLITGLLAILKAGGAYVPLNPDDPPPRLRQQVKDAGIYLAVTQETLAHLFTDLECKLICVDRDRERLSREPDANLEALALPQNLAYVIYTSGSTGEPKGVGITHQSLINYVHAIGARLKPEAFGTGRQPSYATVSTISADLGNTAIFPSLASGGCLHVLSYETATNGNAFANYLTVNSIDVLKIVPSHLSALLEVEPDPSKSWLPKKWLVLGGEALPLSLIKQLRTLSVSCHVMNHYGPTESTIGSLTFDLAEWNGASPDAIVPLGCPLANTRVYILNEHLQPVPVGVAGEMYLSGDGLARGYLNAPGLTAERFLPHPFGPTPGQRLYRTGDTARYQPNGNVEFLGRRDEQVKLHGYRIELAEVAAVLGEATGVRQAVVAVRDVTGEKRLVAYVVLERGTQSPDVGRLRDHAKQYLPEYMIPAAFVAVERIPLTANGKIDRHALPAPGEAQVKIGREHVDPRTQVEKELARLWEQVLHAEGIGIHDNFFELGGDSVVAIQVITGANRVGLYFSVKDMFEHQTIAVLAEHVSMTPPVQTEPSQPSLPKLDYQVLEKIVGKVSFEE